MNQTFDLHRLRLLLRLELAEKGKNYLLMGGLLIGLMLVMMLPVILVKEFSQLHIFSHALALFMIVMFGGSLYTSSVFSQYASPDTGISALMIPASQLEKFLTSLLINLLFTIPVTVFYIKFHYWSLEFANTLLPATSNKYYPIPPDIMRYFIYTHIVIQGAVFLGSIYFKKLAYIKTAGFLFLIFVFLFAANLYLVYQYTSDPSKVVAFPFGTWQVHYYKSNQYYNLDYAESVKSLIYAFPIFFLLCTWFISYVRLKEKEI